MSSPLMCASVWFWPQGSWGNGNRACVTTPSWSLAWCLDDLELLWFHTSFIPKPQRAAYEDPGLPLSMSPQALPKKCSTVPSSFGHQACCLNP